MPPRSRAFLGLGLLITAFAGFAWTGDLRAHTYAYLILYAIAAIGYLSALSGRQALPLPVVIVGALVLRALLLPTEPSLSDDYHRYLWDGLVQQADINPYRYTPTDGALDGIPYADRAQINHPRVETIYPPLAELSFLGLTSVGLGSVLGLKVALGALELCTGVIIALTVGPTRRRAAMATYLLHPLVIQEVWGSAHIDAAHVLLMAAGLLAIVRGHDLTAGLALGAGAAFKLAPLVLLIPAVLGARPRSGRFLAGFTVAFVLPYVPFAAHGPFLGSLTRTDATPEFNSSIFWLLDLVLPYDATRVVCIGLYLVGAVWLARRFRGRRHAPQAFAWTLIWATLLLPVVHPWYWLGPIALGAVAAIDLPALLGLTAPASYVTYVQTPFRQETWARVVSYVPLAAWRDDLKALVSDRTKTKPNAAR